MKILGVDWGEAKIGLSLAEGSLVSPLGVIAKRNWRQKILRICQEEKIEKIVVGISEGKTAEKTRSFAQDLAKLSGLPLEFQDETLTTQEATAKMRQRDKRTKEEDAISAALILQAYLETQKR